MLSASILEWNTTLLQPHLQISHLQRQVWHHLLHCIINSQFCTHSVIIFMACLCHNNINIKIQRVHILQNPNMYQQLIVITFPLDLFHNYGLNFPMSILCHCKHIFQVWLLMDYYMNFNLYSNLFYLRFSITERPLSSFFLHTSAIVTICSSL